MHDNIEQRVTTCTNNYEIKPCIKCGKGILIDSSDVGGYTIEIRCINGCFSLINKHPVFVSKVGMIKKWNELMSNQIKDERQIYKEE